MAEKKQQTTETANAVSTPAEKIQQFIESYGFDKLGDVIMGFVPSVHGKTWTDKKHVTFVRDVDLECTEIKSAVYSADLAGEKILFSRLPNAGKKSDFVIRTETGIELAAAKSWQILFNAFQSGITAIVTETQPVKKSRKSRK